GLGRRIRGVHHVRIRQGIRGLWPRLLEGSQEGGLAQPQGSHPDDALRARVQRRHGAVPMADRQDPRMGVLRPDLGVEEVMSDITGQPESSLAEVAGTETPAVPAKPVHPDIHWYVVHAYSGMEKAVERNIRERINRAGMQDMFGEILVPTEEVVEIKNGQKKTSERRFYP